MKTDISWTKDGYIEAEGKTWDTSCSWSPECSQDWALPAVGVLSLEERARAWENHRYTDARVGPGEFVDEIEARRKERREAIKEYERQRALEATAKIKAAHPDEKYDPKKKKWVPKIQWFTCPLCAGKTDAVTLAGSARGSTVGECPRCKGEGKVHT